MLRLQRGLFLPRHLPRPAPDQLKFLVKSLASPASILEHFDVTLTLCCRRKLQDLAPWLDLAEIRLANLGLRQPQETKVVTSQFQTELTLKAGQIIGSRLLFPSPSLCLYPSCNVRGSDRSRRLMNRSLGCGDAQFHLIANTTKGQNLHVQLHPKNVQGF